MTKPNISIELDVSGIDRLLATIPGKADDVLDVAAHRIERRAKASMKGGGSPHQPSKPGEPPHRDTSALVNSIHVEARAPLSRDIMDGVDYGIHQEFGTSRMAARPWLSPAVEAEREYLVEAWGQLFT